MERTPAQDPGKGLAYLAGAALLWSTSGLFIKILALSAFHIACYRSLVSALAIVVILKVLKRFAKNPELLDGFEPPEEEPDS